MHKNHQYRGIFTTMLAFGIVGLLASFVLTLEKFYLIENPGAALSCSLSVVLNCGPVMETWQSSLFGFPNMLIGLMAYSVVITVAVAGLYGIRLDKKFMQIATVCYGVGFVFAYWLFFQSLYVIQILCPWCLIVTLATTFLFASIVTYAVRENIFSAKHHSIAHARKFVDAGWHKLAVASWLLLMVVLVFLQFGTGLWAV